MKKERLKMQIKYAPILISYVFNKRIRHSKVKLHEYLVNSVAQIEATLFADPSMHEPEVSEFLYKTKGKLFVDVGANLGRYEVLLSRNYERIIAIEPSLENISFLKRNVDNAKVKNVDFLHCAVADEDGVATLFYGDHCAAHSLIEQVEIGHLAEGTEQVRTISLDTLLKKEDNIDLVKVDVEGAEWQVLEGSKEVLPRIKQWMIELHDLEQKARMTKLLEDEGYVVLWLDNKHVYARRP